MSKPLKVVAISDTSSFPNQVAIELKSPELAIIIQFFFNVIAAHKRAGRNQIQGRTWNYVTASTLIEYFPYWSYDQIKRLLQKLVKMGIFLRENFNADVFDKTNWYAFADEEKWGISNISYDERNRSIERAKSLDLYHIDNNDHSSSIEEVNDLSIQCKKHIPKKRSLPRRTDLSGSMLEPREKKKKAWKDLLTPDQRDSFEWLMLQGIDSSEDTLAFWARTYSLSRLQEVHQEALKKHKKSLGAYMQKLLKACAVVSSGRVAVNRELCEEFKAFNSWHSLEVFEKYAKFSRAGVEIEIDFNMDPEDFAKYLLEKYRNLC